jgi:hypothetical protein
MKILIVTTNTTIDYFDKLQFQHFADPSEIEISYGFEAGKDFIRNNLIVNQKHLDFIIITNQEKKKDVVWKSSFDESDINEFAYWIRNLSQTYSSDNFQIRSIPIILDDHNTYHKSLFINSYKQSYYDLILDFKYVNQDKLVYFLSKPINHWLNKLGDELDKFDLDTQFNFQTSLVGQKDSFDVKILSTGFFRRQQELNYIWIGNNIKKLYIDSDTYKELLKKSAKLKNLRNEKEYHNYFLKNKGLLLGDEYFKTIYENHFYYPSSFKYVEPDFVNLSHSYSFNLPQIFEVKLPNQKILNFRGNLSRYWKKSFEQVCNKYFKYFNDLINKFQIENGLGQLPSNFTYTLLIGRKIDKEENEEALKKYFSTNPLKIDLITYDELLANYQRIYNRVKRFGIN